MPQDDKALEELRVARNNGDIDHVRRLFDKGRLDGNDASDKLNSYLHDPELLRCLLEHGADPNVVKSHMIRSCEELRILTEFGFDIKSKGHLVLQNFARDQDTLDWLLDQGVDVNLPNTGQLDDGFHLTPGEYDYSIKVLNNVAAAGDIQLFDHLVARGADVTKSLALHSASKCGDDAPAMIAHLLDRHNMDIHADTADLRDFFHYARDSGTPLCSAVLHHNLAAVEFLLKRGADPKDSANTGYSPVFEAVGAANEAGFLPALKPLLDAGADSTAAMNCAIRYGKLEAVNVCLQAGEHPATALKMALEYERKRFEREAKDAEFLGTTQYINEGARRSSHAMIEMLVEKVNGR